jgi:hypothetical protein
MQLEILAKGGLRDQDLAALPGCSLKSGEVAPTYKITNVLILAPEYSRRFAARQQIRLILENGIQMLMHTRRCRLKTQASLAFLNSPIW